MQRYTERQLKAVWNPLARIAEIHRPESVGWSPQYMKKTHLFRQADSTLTQQQSGGQASRFELVSISTDGYRGVHNEWRSCLYGGGKRLRSILSQRNIASNLVAFFDEVENSQFRMLLHEMEVEITDGNEKKLIRLDQHMIALAMILRSALSKRQSSRLGTPKRKDVETRQFEALLVRANRVCPTLLEWALTWSEIFIVRSAG